MQQAQHFLATVGSHNGQILAVDIEWTTDQHGQHLPSITLQQARDLVTEIHNQTGRWPLVYGGGDYLAGLLHGGSDAVLAGCPLWWAQYNTAPHWPTSTWNTYALWQYTDGTHGPGPHAVPGIGPCDRDIFNGSLDELEAFWSGSAAGGPMGLVAANEARAGGAANRGGGAPVGGEQTPDADPEGGCEADVDIANERAVAFSAPPMPKPVPPGNPVPFAQSATPPDDRFWPVITNHPSRLVVSYETVGGQTIGSPGRRFLASRNGGARFHVAIDLFAHEGDTVVACEAGKIVSFYAFYPSSSGEMTYALLVEHGSFVVNYGEVKKNSPQTYGWKVGDAVAAGQPIATVSSTAMTHFETYKKGTVHNQKWLVGNPRPPALLNPTSYLLELISS